MRPIILLLLAGLLSACQAPTDSSTEGDSSAPAGQAEEVIRFTGMQVTGVTISQKGRMFVNFPRWRPGVPMSVAEVDMRDSSYRPYPDTAMNTWSLGNPLRDSVFVSVQSVVAFDGKLYVLDTRNPQFEGVLDAPRIFVFDLADDQLIDIHDLGPATKPNSYVNDLRVDSARNRIYLTDSNEPALIVLDLERGQARRILEGHPSTSAEADHLTINGKRWNNTVHADGIAFNPRQDHLYFHALTGYHLYALSPEVLDQPDSVIANSVKMVMETPAPDGMIMDDVGTLYFGDLEGHRVMALYPEGDLGFVLADSSLIKWPDTFTLYQSKLYYTNSRIHEAGADVSGMTFGVYRIE